MSERAFERFVRRLHRRLVWTRAAENLGICISIGCGIALPLLAVLVWRDRGVFSFLMLDGMVCLLAACAMTVRRWPSDLDAAAEADRQLNLNDLLTTAVRMDGSRADAMSETVLAMANAKCAGISPAVVILNRYGAPVWGGIVLSLAAVMAVSLIPAHPIRSAGAQDERSILSDDAKVAGQAVIANTHGDSNVEPASETSNRSNRMTNPAELGTGGNVETTDHSTRSSPLVADASAGKSVDSMTGALAGGGRSAENASARGEVSGLGTSTAQRRIEPWQASGQNIGPQTVDPVGENVPSGDRDLVKRYFDRN